MTRTSTLALSVAMLGLLLFAPGCATELDEADWESMQEGHVQLFTNQTGTRFANGLNTPADDFLIQMIDRAEVTVDVATMGFSRREVVDALIRAYHRGIQIRFVGDGRHLEGHVYGYDMLEVLDIEMMSGNQFHIMHNKFFVIDGRYVFTGTGNMTPTGFDRNDNNYVFIDSPQVAADFTDEFEQMLRGASAPRRIPLDNGNAYEVGDTVVEVYFSPQEDAMGRILEAIDEGDEQSIHFMIFAFTKDQVGSALIARHLDVVALQPLL